MVFWGEWWSGRMWPGMDEIEMGLNTNFVGGRQLLHKSNRPHEQRATRRL